MRYKFIDLFAGIGGFRLAFDNLSCECVMSSEIDIEATKTYEANFGDKPLGDICAIKSIPYHSILLAGFPCQPFSLAGKRKGFEDTRGTLFFEILRILKSNKPKSFLLENVAGLINHDKGNTFQVILNSLKGLGYKVFYEVINSKDLGIPQNRSRIYIVGFLNKRAKFTFPKPIFNIELEDIIDWNNLECNLSPTVLNHIKNHSSSGLLINQGKLSLITEMRPSRCNSRGDGISPCLTAKMGTGGNNIPVIYSLKRTLSLEEALQIMTFPKDFKLPNSKMASYKQIGNSVVTQYVQSIGEVMIKTLDSLRRRRRS